MADGLQFEVRGATNLSRTARAAAQDFRDLSDPNRAAAQQVAARARPPRRTGRLASSIGVIDVGPAEATVGSGLIYAPVIEFGWPAHGIEAAGFLAEAADGAMTAVTEDFAAYADRTLAQVKGV